jgi:hypothetical protein
MEIKMNELITDRGNVVKHKTLGLGRAEHCQLCFVEQKVQACAFRETDSATGATLIHPSSPKLVGD